nr:hypothetical protein [Tanacetum cinerariifolium]
ARISIPAPVPVPAWSDSEVARLLAMSSPPSSPLSLLSSQPPQIPFPPLPLILSPPSPMLSPAPPFSRIRESSSAAARPVGGLRADYGFVATMDREIRRDSEREVGYRITDSWDEINKRGGVRLDSGGSNKDPFGLDFCRQPWGGGVFVWWKPLPMGYLFGAAEAGSQRRGCLFGAAEVGSHVGGCLFGAAEVGSHVRACLFGAAEVGSHVGSVCLMLP